MRTPKINLASGQAWKSTLGGRIGPLCMVVGLPSWQLRWLILDRAARRVITTASDAYTWDVLRALLSKTETKLGLCGTKIYINE